MPGIRAEVKIHSPSVCPVTAVSRELGASTSTVRTARPDPETVTEEFVMDADPEVTAADLDLVGEDLDRIFSYGTEQAFRFERSPGDCPCEDVERFGCPLLNVYARDDALVLVFHAADVETLRDVLTNLTDRWSDVSVHRLIRSGEDRADEDLVLVDKSDLTDRQADVLETAHEMGYFDHPKGANAGEVAAELGITQATFAEHLAAAQRKLLSTIMTDSDH